MSSFLMILWIVLTYHLGMYLFRLSLGDKPRKYSPIVNAIVSGVIFGTIYRAVSTSGGTTVEGLIGGTIFGGISFIIGWGIVALFEKVKS